MDARSRNVVDPGHAPRRIVCNCGGELAGSEAEKVEILGEILPSSGYREDADSARSPSKSAEAISIITASFLLRFTHKPSNSSIEEE
ncbi:hypothetical protein F2Q69_00008680 [Brassica cretica]|uniref:Uncharacterized protein n=1 Tax=Brassica cretica TaxID=69181 RepID=A0A8S9P775_BRACR|nr:hypothetical protein F2Q69_00008680 [Brassica cretica]